MRIAIVLLLLAGCAARPSMIDCPQLASFAREAVMRELRHPNGTVAARGLALRDFPLIRTGAWTYWYDDGAKHAEITYALGCYTQCCAAGLCPQTHDYATGAFTLWHRSGKKLGEGTFRPVWRHVDTSCEGGDDMIVGVVSRSSRFWREDGSAMRVDEGLAYFPENERAGP